jgi:hypothetical protein
VPTGAHGTVYPYTAHLLVIIIIIRQIRTWRPEISVLTQTGIGSDTGKLNRKKRTVFQQYKATNAREIAQLIETLKQKVQAKTQRIRRYEKRETQYIKNKMFKADTKKFYRRLGAKKTEAKETPSMTVEPHYYYYYWRLG